MEKHACRLQVEPGNELAMRLKSCSFLGKSEPSGAYSGGVYKKKLVVEYHLSSYRWIDVNDTDEIEFLIMNSSSPMFSISKMRSFA